MVVADKGFEIVGFRSLIIVCKLLSLLSFGAKANITFGGILSVKSTEYFCILQFEKNKPVMNKKKEENDKKLVIIFLYIMCRSLKTRAFALQFLYHTNSRI